MSNFIVVKPSLKSCQTGMSPKGDQDGEGAANRPQEASRFQLQAGMREGRIICLRVCENWKCRNVLYGSFETDLGMVNVLASP